MYIADGKIVSGDMTSNAMGGTELLAHRLIEKLDPEILEPYQIFLSRKTHDFLPDKKPVYWAHDTESDPAAVDALGNGKWRQWFMMVFVSYWQKERFIAKFGLPHEKCFVIPNFTAKIEDHRTHKEPDEPIRLAYWSTPHRGLEILYPVFDSLSQEYNITLDVFSSFKLYGWEERDQHYQELFELLDSHPKINNHGSKPNHEVIQAIQNMDILAYPSIWPETSCMVLMEAMQAGLACVHSDLAALPETAHGMTMMYNYIPDPNKHAGMFYNNLEYVIKNLDDCRTNSILAQEIFNGSVALARWRMILSALSNTDYVNPEIISI